MEVWRAIPGFEGKYEVSSHGRIRSLSRHVSHWQGGMRFRHGKVRKPTKDKDGYLAVSLPVGERSRMIPRKVHRIVASTFIPNPLGYPMINHKDENPANNHVENLEWCDAKYNSNYGTCTARKTQTRIKRYSRRIVGTNAETGERIEFDYVAMAKLMGFSSCHISSCLTGNRKTHGGYTWEYADMPDDGSGKHYLAKPESGDNDDLGGV